MKTDLQFVYLGQLWGSFFRGLSGFLPKLAFPRNALGDIVSKTWGCRVNLGLNVSSTMCGYISSSLLVCFFLQDKNSTIKTYLQDLKACKGEYIWITPSIDPTEGNCSVHSTFYYSLRFLYPLFSEWTLKIPLVTLFLKVPQNLQMVQLLKYEPLE